MHVYYNMEVELKLLKECGAGEFRSGGSPRFSSVPSSSNPSPLGLSRIACITSLSSHERPGRRNARSYLCVDRGTARWKRDPGILCEEHLDHFALMTLDLANDLGGISPIGTSST